MRKLQTAEVARMVTSQEESFNDLCDIYQFVGAADSLGDILETYGTGAFVKYDDSDYTLFGYVGASWSTSSDPTSYLATHHLSNNPGDYAIVHITGRQFVIYGYLAPVAGVADVYLDGVKIGSLDENDPSWTWGVVYTSPVFDNGPHIVKIVVMTLAIVIDAIEVMETTPTISSSPCGFSVGPQSRNERGQVVTLDADAVLRTDQSINVKDKVVARSVEYIVDGVTPGRHVTIAALKEIKI